MDNTKLTPYEAVITALIFIAGLVSITFVVLYVYALIHYGGTPLSECPVWVFWILKGGI